MFNQIATPGSVSPLRTAHASFPAYGSGPTKALLFQREPGHKYKSNCVLSELTKQPIHKMRWGAHDEFSSSFICFPQFIGSVKLFAIKHPSKVSLAFACNYNSIAIHLITRWHSLRSTSLSGVSRCLAVTVLSWSLSRRERRASTFHRINEYVSLGPSCPPADLHLRISCVNRL